MLQIFLALNRLNNNETMDKPDFKAIAKQINREHNEVLNHSHCEHIYNCLKSGMGVPHVAKLFVVDKGVVSHIADLAGLFLPDEQYTKLG